MDSSVNEFNALLLTIGVQLSETNVAEVAWYYKVPDGIDHSTSSKLFRALKEMAKLDNNKDQLAEFADVLKTIHKKKWAIIIEDFIRSHHPESAPIAASNDHDEAVPPTQHTDGSRADGGPADGGRAYGGRAEGGRAKGGRADGGRADGRSDADTRGRCYPETGITRQASLSSYKMEADPRGICVIINNVDFNGMDRIPSNDSDAMNLANTFQWLKFDVYNGPCYKNKTASEISKISKSFAAQPHNDNDAFVFCVLSYGSEQDVYGTDGKKVEIEAIRKRFNGVNCKSLVGKPKLFIFQSCRTLQADAPYDERPHDTERTRDIDLNSDPPKIEGELPDDTDWQMWLGATVSDSDLVESQKANWFITDICDSLRKHADQRHISDIFVLANNVRAERLRCNGAVQGNSVYKPVGSFRRDCYLKQEQSYEEFLGAEEERS